VTGFGSVIVNQSIHGTTAATEFERNGVPSSQAEFRVGDVVVIEWDSDDGGLTREATRVSYQRELFGEVTGDPDEVAQTVEVLGQTVRADATTIFEDFDPVPAGAIFPPNLVQGACVEVTGFRDASGSLFATRIELEDSCPSTVEIQGSITSVSTNTIVVSGTTVDTTTATVTPVGTSLQTGQFVKVEGSFAASVLNADEIEILDADLSALEDDDVDLEGLISDFSGSEPVASFEVSGIPVVTDALTQYENGNFASLANNVRIEVEGTFSSGVLIAEEIEFKLDGSVKMETVVLDANGTTGEVTLRYGNETLLVLTDPLITQLRDETGNYDPFGIGDLNSGDYVKIAAFVDGTDIVASKLELEELAGPTVDEERVLQGPITDLIGSPIPSSIEILDLEGTGAGVTVPTVDLTECEDAAGNAVLCSDLLITLQIGDIVQAQGGEDVGLVDITWDELELED
jgi:hypothetical protein